MSQILFKNMSLLDPKGDEARGGYEVLVEGDTIREVSAKPIKAAQAKVVDCGKRTLMPGLIDCHVHVFLTEVNIRNLESVPLTLLTAKSAELMRGMIDRGFTTVRDTGGADWGIKTAVESGPIPAAARTRARPAAAATPWSIAWPSPTAPTRCASWCASRCARGRIR